MLLPRSLSSAAILRRMRRMIFPERVFGKAGASCKKNALNQFQTESSRCDETVIGFFSQFSMH